MEDVCLQLARAPVSFDPAETVGFFVRFAGLAKRTPPERIATAVAEELVDQCERALAAVVDLSSPGALAGEAQALLRRCIADASVEAGRAAFPRDALSRLRDQAQALGDAALAERLHAGVQAHEAFEQRLRWLLRGTSPEDLATLDPYRDRDRIVHALSSTFRVESRVLEMLSINRVAVSSSIATFLRGTREAEVNGVSRFYDTFTLLANYFEWGRDSKRGRAAIARMREIHGRYYIPNDRMKFVLLQTAFTWLDGADRIGHRPLAEVERRGFFHAIVEQGFDLQIDDISHDYDEMYGWFRAFNREHATFAPHKRECFETFVHNSAPTAVPPTMVTALLTAARAAMDEDYRAALGYAEASPQELAATRAVFFTLGQLVASMPYTPYLRSLQNNPVRQTDQRPEGLGVSSRSRFMPGPRPEQPNGGFPEGQRPIRSAQDLRPVDLPEIPWEEIQRHVTPESLWIVLEGEVYDVTAWAARHPGGLSTLLEHAGQDATQAFARAGHSAATEVFKLNFRVGRVRSPDAS